MNNGTSLNDQNVSETYGTVTVANCSNSVSNSGTCAMYINGATATNPTSDVLGAGVNSYQVNTSGNSNYSANATGETFYAIVAKANPYPHMNVYIDGAAGNATISYPSVANVSANESITGDSDCNLTLWMDASVIINGSSVWNYTKLGNGTYAFKYNMTACANWTANSTGISYLHVNKGTPTLALAIDGVGSDKSVTSGAQTNTTGSESNDGDSDCTYNLYRNDAGNVTNANPPFNAQTLTAGTYVYVYNTSGGANWTSASATRTLTVSSATTNTGSSSGGLTTSTSTTPQVKIAKDSANITLTSLTTGGKMTATITRFEGIAIRGINITVVNSVANIKLVITRLSVLPQTVSYNINGKVFNYISVEETNIANSDLKTVSLRFAVNKTWLSNNGVADSNVTLYRWNGNSWTELNAAKTGEDSLEVFYQVDSPGLSVFIVGTRGGVSQAVTTPTCTESWSCGEWSTCANDQQTRTCTDANECGTSVSMPSVSQSCTAEAAVVPASTPLPSVNYTVPFIVLIFVIAAFIAIFVYRGKITSHLHWMNINHIKRKRENSRDSIEGKVHVKSAE
jgi:PGF-pre-PGF domain-containing protein